MRAFCLVLLFYFQTAFSQTAEKITPDDFPVTDLMLHEHGKKESGTLLSFDKAWFGNSALKQTLVFELYTDYHRFVTCLFNNNDIPPDLVERMELNVQGGKLAEHEERTKYFNGFIPQAKQVSADYFVSDKGFKSGSKKEKALHIYGQPDSCKIANGIEICEWRFEGDYTDEETPLVKTSKPRAKNSFGYSVTMYFREGKLIAMILFNDIP
jgi:hypothetical protein